MGIYAVRYYDATTGRRLPDDDNSVGDLYLYHLTDAGGDLLQILRARVCAAPRLDPPQIIQVDPCAASRLGPAQSGCLANAAYGVPNCQRFHPLSVHNYTDTLPQSRPESKWAVDKLWITSVLTFRRCRRTPDIWTPIIGSEL